MPPRFFLAPFQAIGACFLLHLNPFTPSVSNGHKLLGLTLEQGARPGNKILILIY